MRNPTPTSKLLARLLLVLLLVPPLPGRAEVVGESVLVGEATVERAGDVTTIHASDGAIIQYDALNVWSHEELHFVQPDSSSRVLNQVRGDATRIDGGLFANGIVYILNPAGVFFGGESLIDVGGLVAAAGHMEAADFGAGRDRFALEGAVENHGRIEATSVALLGRRVANHGLISAPAGTIALVAGERVLLTRPGGHLHIEVEGPAGLGEGPALEQTGSVDAGSGEVRFTTGDHYSLALNHEGITRGGSIELRAASGTVRVAGELDARDTGEDGLGGAIAVTGERVSLEGAELDASGTRGGGEIRVGGDLRGQGSLPNARRTVVDAESRLVADALETGDGGRVIVWADEATAFLGGISARGGEEGGDGGFAEVSGAVFLWSDGDVDLRAVHGRHGTLLYDPQDIEIRGGVLDGSDAPDSLADRLGGDGDALGVVLEADLGNLDMPFVIYTSEIEGSAADIRLEATNSIFSSETLDMTLLADRSLALQTRNAAGDDAGSTAPASGIALADVSFTTSGAGSIRAETGTAADAAVTADIAIGGLTTGGGAVDLSTANGAIDVNGAITTASAAGDGGSVAIAAGDLDGAADSDVSIAGGLDTRGGAGAAGGAISVTTAGSPQPFPDSTDTPDTGGGAIAIGGAIDARGGGGATAGGAGGAVTLAAEGGAVSAMDIDTSGGDGTGAGGAGGAITLSTAATDYDDPIESSDANDITTGALLARGGAGGTGSGGAGGAVDLRTRASERVARSDPDDPRLADGGGAISVASIRTDGGEGADGGAGGAIRLDTDGEATDVDVTGALSSRGGEGLDGAGGAGGGVSVFTQDGAAAIGAESFTLRGVAVDASVISAGGQGTTSGGAGGFISIDLSDLDGDGDTLSDGESPISVAGALVSAGGNGGSGAGGAGARILARSLGERVDIGGTNDPVRGGGALALGDVDTRGGDGSNGGVGGEFVALTTEGTIDVGAVDSSGGAGAEVGGSAGDISVQSLDSNQDDANDIDTGLLAARGGAGGTGAGGRGGSVTVNVFPAGEIVDDDDNVLQEQAGSGDISVPLGISVEGGAGGTTGGNAGSVFVGVGGLSAGGGLPTVAVGDAATAAVAGRGGEGVERGGRGASVVIGAAAGDVAIGAIDTRGGDATGADALGGDGGRVESRAGNDPDAPAGELLLLGNVDAREGASTVVLVDPGDPDFGTTEQIGNRARMSGVDGGDVFLFGADGLEHGGQAGPHVRTTADVSLESGADLGAAAPFFVEGEGERRVVLGRFADTDTLFVAAAGLARVEATNAGFLGGLDVSATGTSVALDIEVVQPGAAGDDRVTIVGQGGRAVVTEADGSGNQIALAVRLRNRDTDTRDDGTLLLQTGAIVAGDAFEASSDGDLIVGDADGVVIEAGTLNEPDPVAPPPGPIPVPPPDPLVPEGAPVTLLADADSDGTGAVLDALGAAEGGIDLRRDMQEPARLIVSGAAVSREAASSEAGVGDRGAPLVLIEGGVIESARVSPRKEADDFDPENPVFVADPDAEAGIFLAGRGAEELDVISAEVEAGTGDIELYADSNLRISGPLVTLPGDPVTQGTGGDILLQSVAGGRIILDPVAPLRSGGRQTWDGPVGLARNVQIQAVGGLETTDTVDVDPESEAGGLFAQLGGDSRFGADVGATSAPTLLILQALVDTDPTVTFDLDVVTTKAAQLYDVNVALARDATFSTPADIFFERDLDAEVADAAAATVMGATGVDFGGDVGVGGRLRGLTVQTTGGSLVRFDSEEASQSVVTGAEGLLIDTGLSAGGRTRVPAVATVARVGGDLLLRSEGGDVMLANGEKLSGTRDIALEAPGNTVSFTDVNAVRNFSADAASIRVYARRAGEVRLPSGARVGDAGADLFVNDAIFSVPVEVVAGGGETPRIVTPGGTATAPGGLQVVSLGRTLVESDLLPEGPGGVVLDLAFPLIGPGFESQELDVDPVHTPLGLWVSAERAAPPEAPDPQQVASLLGCALDAERSDCPDAGSFPPGSPLATPRAAELTSQLAVLARSARHLGARRALARAAADPGAPLVRSDTLDYLKAVARWEAESRLLGLDEAGQAAARQTLLDAVVSGVSSPDLDAELLWKAVESLEIAPAT